MLLYGEEWAGLHEECLRKTPRLKCSQRSLAKDGGLCGTVLGRKLGSQLKAKNLAKSGNPQVPKLNLFPGHIGDGSHFPTEVRYRTQAGVSGILVVLYYFLLFPRELRNCKGLALAFVVQILSWLVYGILQSKVDVSNIPLIPSYFRVKESSKYFLKDSFFFFLKTHFYFRSWLITDSPFR